MTSTVRRVVKRQVNAFLSEQITHFCGTILNALLQQEGDLPQQFNFRIESATIKQIKKTELALEAGKSPAKLEYVT